ncbi:MAG TPA: EAL domain-containing protein [Thermoanaerobaculia bacterium]|nr:EAL domain-containing protein [Thermoanaerobaculia bacterium]
MTVRALDTDSSALPNELYRLLAETTAVGVAVYRQDGILWANLAVEEITGYRRDELLTMAPLDLVHPDDREAIAQRLAARLRGERPPGERFESRFLAADGSEHWVEVAAAKIDWEEGSAALATLVDVTERRRVESELRESRERLALAQSAARYVTWEWNVDTDELLIDPSARQVYGLEPSEMGSTGEEFLHRMVHPEDRDVFRNAMAAVRSAPTRGGKFEAEVRFVLPGGVVRWVGERAHRVTDSRVVGVATDIDERKRTAIALQEEKERALVTLASIGDGVIRTDAEGRIDYMNAVAERMTGWATRSAAGRPLADVYRVIDEATRKPLADPLQVCLGQRRVVELPGSSLLLRRDGREFAIQDSASPIVTGDGRLTGAVLVFRDVTHERGMEREVSFLVTHDPLTGLINRHELERRVERVRDRAEQGIGGNFAVACLDLDEFKLVNDTCGYLAGDQLLQQLAERLAAAIPPGATLARLGGDEFAVLLESTEPGRARLVAESLRDVVRGVRFEWDGRPFTVSASIGLVPKVEKSIDGAEVLAAADAACNIAKEEGRNRIHEYQPEDAGLAARYGEMHWVHRIQKALEDERFVLHRQPIQPLTGGTPLVEVFIRLQGEDGELIAPGAFIPAAERFHLIPSIDRWVVATAMRHLAAHPEDERCHALNLSGQSLGDETFLDFVVQQLETTGLDPTRVCFEITETAAITHLARANRFISVLRRMGCHFVLDDFGTGLSSFAYLKNLPVDFLKVSGDFVRGIPANEVQNALVRSIHELGNLMGMRTIAEGVETEEELEEVRKIGFDYAQGYWIERPAPM